MKRSKSCRSYRAALIALVLSLAGSVAAPGQITATPATPAAAPVARGKVAPLLEPVLDAAGTRFRAPGRERVTALVEVKSPAGVSLLSGQITWEWPGKLAFSAGGPAVVFTPWAAPATRVDATIADVARTLLEDTLDGFLSAYRNGAAVRVIGTGYPDPDRPGNAVDVISLHMPSSLDGGKTTVRRQYWFDVRSRTLARVIQGESGAQTYLTDWQTFQGEKFPTTITAVQNNKAVKYVLKFAPTGVTAKQNDGVFGGR
jgi:hypothetical protein